MQSNPSKTPATARRPWRRLGRLCLTGIAAWLLVACAPPGGPPLSSVPDPAAALPPNRDSAPLNPPDLSAVPDAVPRAEAPSKWGNPKSYEVFGQSYHTLPSSQGYSAEGIASWYGTAFHGKRTSSGEPYDMYAMTAAHRSLPLPTYLEVVNLDNQRRVVVRVNDRGPFHPDRVIDLSYAAATRLGIVATGTGRVRLRAIQPDAPAQAAAAAPTLPPEPKPAAIPTQGGGERIYLQLGAFSQRDNAEQLRQRLLQAKLPTLPIEVSVGPDREAPFRLRLGPLRGTDQLQRLRAGLRTLGIADAYLIREPHRQQAPLPPPLAPSTDHKGL